MSKIDDLIQKLCPDGVEFGSIGKMLKNYDNLRRPVTKSNRHEGQYSYYGANGIQDYVDDYIFDGVFLLVGEDGSVKDESGRPILNWLDGKAWINNHAHVLQSANDDLDLRFVYFYLSTIDISGYVTGGTQPKLNQQNLNRIAIPVPPLPVQEEIVRILDSFTSLEAELEAELEARKKQYEYYRHLLLRRASSHSQEMHLAQLGHIITGRTPKSSDSDAWGSVIDFITPSDISNGMKTVISPQRMLSSHGVTLLGNARVPKQSILVTCIGADMGKTVINAHECVTNQQINSLVLNEDIDANYVFHVLSSMRGQLLAKGQRAGGTMPIINKRDFSSIQIPIPDMQTQHDVASTLDSFDSLVSDLSSGLPAEIAARRQQYEYYRDRLLTFKELPA